MDVLYLALFVVLVMIVSFYASRYVLFSKKVGLEKVVILIPSLIGGVFVLGIIVYEAVVGVGKFSTFVYPFMFILTAFISVIGTTLNLLFKKHDE